MFKKIVSIFIRRTSQVVVAQEPLVHRADSFRDEANAEIEGIFRVYRAIVGLKAPCTVEEERYMSEEVVRNLGEDALTLLPLVHRALEGSAWQVVWMKGQISFVYVAGAKERHRVLLEEIAEASWKSKGRAGELFLTGVCSAFIELDSWLKERLDANEMLDAQDAINAALAPGWRIKIYNGRNHRIFCYAIRPDISSKEKQWPDMLAVTIH